MDGRDVEATYAPEIHRVEALSGPRRTTYLVALRAIKDGETANDRWAAYEQAIKSL
jgi:hypothetical protein